MLHCTSGGAPDCSLGWPWGPRGAFIAREAPLPFPLLDFASAALRVSTIAAQIEPSSDSVKDTRRVGVAMAAHVGLGALA